VFSNCALDSCTRESKQGKGHGTSMLKTTVREHLLRRDSNNNTCDNDVAKRRNALRVSDRSNELVESRVVESRNERNR
jgi:hypothetical protein